MMKPAPFPKRDFAGTSSNEWPNIESRNRPRLFSGSGFAADVSFVRFAGRVTVD